MNTATINARIDAKIKERAVNILHSLGINTSEAIGLYFIQIIYNNGIPFDIKIPNKMTRKAVKELESKKGKKVSTAKELFEDLNR